MTPQLVGITGGIGVGKSLVARIFLTLGTPIYNADNRAKYLLNNDSLLQKQIIDTFGKESYEEGLLNRNYLAKVVFNSQEKLNQLNALVHPRVQIDFDNWCLKYQDSPYLIKEAALLYETGAYKRLDKMIVVDASLELRIHRIKQRDSFRSEAEIKNIIQKQLSNDEKVKKADFVVQNDEKELVITQVLSIHNQLIEK